MVHVFRSSPSNVWAMDRMEEFFDVARSPELKIWVLRTQTPFKTSLSCNVMFAKNNLTGRTPCLGKRKTTTLSLMLNWKTMSKHIMKHLIIFCENILCCWENMWILTFWLHRKYNSDILLAWVCGELWGEMCVYTGSKVPPVPESGAHINIVTERRGDQTDRILCFLSKYSTCWF